MKYISYFIKFFYRIRYWLIFGPLLVALLVFWKTAYRPQNYTANCSIYTGIITGVNILSESGITTTTYTQSSMMENLLSLITSDQTLKEVSLRLYARIMVHGDLNKNNIYINADHFRYLYDHGAPIRHLIDKSSSNDSINEQRTYENLKAFETSDPDNYVYGIYQYQLPYVNRAELQKIIVERKGNSDMIDVSYTTNDPGIVYQTLLILMEEFIHQYQELRFGETNNVIAYFEAELKRISDSLKRAENDLTDYRITKSVINYGEETKVVAALSRDYELQYWTSKNDYITSDSLIREFEKRMGLNAGIMKNNKEYLYYNDIITRLTNQLTLANYYSEDKISRETKDSLKKELDEASKALEQIVIQYGNFQYSKEGISNASIVSEWLNQVTINKKAEAELKVLEDRRADMSTKYTHFAPIGSTLNRKERTVNITEQQYYATLNALNSARLRQKSLLMTSATLKVMNDPIYPLSSQSENRKKIVFAAFFAALLFIIFFSLLIELVDHTLRHKLKAESLTGSRVLGAFARPLLRNRRYNALYRKLSAQTVCNQAITYFKNNRNNIINLISNEPGEGKSFVMQEMAEQFISQGFQVVKLSCHEDIETDPRSFIQSLNSTGSSDGKNYTGKIILVEYPALTLSALSQEIVQGASLNLQIIDSRKTWKNTDQEMLERTREMSGRPPLFLVLNYTKQDAAEELNGLMPPYSFFRKLFYRFSQLGLTASDNLPKNV